MNELSPLGIGCADVEHPRSLPEHGGKAAEASWNCAGTGK